MPLLYLVVRKILSLPEAFLGALLSLLGLIGILILFHVKGRPRYFCTNLGDYAALCSICTQLVSLTISIGPSNTIHSLVPYTTALDLYFVVRLISCWRLVTRKALLQIMIAFGLLLAVADLTFQVQQIHASRIFPSSSLSSLRAALELVGSATKNDSLAVVLCILSYTSVGALGANGKGKLFQIFSIAVTAGLTTVLALSFSRSIYLALGVFGLALTIPVVLRRTVSWMKLAIVGGTVCISTAGAIVYLDAQHAILDTLRGENTISQERSTEGRLNIWERSSEAILEHPLLGSGGGTAGLRALKRLRNPDMSFSARSYNATLDILESTGVVGLVCYGIFLLYPLVVVARSVLSPVDHISPSSVTMVLAAGLLALIARDMTYSSLMMDGSTIVIVWVTVGILQNAYSRGIGGPGTLTTRWSIRTLALVAVAISTISCVLCFYVEIAEGRYRNGCAKLVAGNYREARCEFALAIQDDPKQPMFYAADALATINEVLDASFTSESWRTLPVLTERQKVLLSGAALDYTKALGLSGDDGVFWSNLAWIEALRGNNSIALEDFQHAIRSNPNDPVARVGEGLLFERNGQEAYAYEQYAYALTAAPRIVDSRFFADLRSRDPEAGGAILERSCQMLITLPTSPIRLASLGKLHEAMGQVRLAHDEYVKALSLLPNLSYAWANLGRLDLQSNRLETARIELKRAMFLDESNRFAANLLAAIAFNENQTSDAQKLYARALLIPDVSVHAKWAWQIYYLPAPIVDDLEPPGLLSYVSPEFQALRICDDVLFSTLRATDGSSQDIIRRIIAQEDLCAVQ
jgi:tetratricopeptide (TPR) repeat protein/O-antigen ligase